MDRLIKKINKYWMMAFVALAIVFVGLAITFINLNVQGGPNFENKVGEQAKIFLVLAGYTVVNSIICIYTNLMLSFHHLLI